MVTKDIFNLLKEDRIIVSPRVVYIDNSKTSLIAIEDLVTLLGKVADVDVAVKEPNTVIKWTPR